MVNMMPQLEHKNKVVHNKRIQEVRGIIEEEEENKTRKG